MALQVMLFDNWLCLRALKFVENSGVAQLSTAPQVFNTNIPWQNLIPDQSHNVATLKQQQ